MHRACDGWHASLVEYRNRTRHSERESGELRCIIQPRKLFDIDPSNFANSINNREKRKRAGIPAGWVKYTSENIEKMSKFPFCAGWNYSKDCPKEPRIPMYLVIGGTFGTMLMMLLIYSQIQSRRPEMPPVPSNRPQISFMKLIIIVLSCFLLGWFVMGKKFFLRFVPEHATPCRYGYVRLSGLNFAMGEQNLIVKVTNKVLLLFSCFDNLLLSLGNVTIIKRNNNNNNTERLRFNYNSYSINI